MNRKLIDGNNNWVIVCAEGFVIETNMSAAELLGVIGFAYANPADDFCGFFGASGRAKAEEIEREDPGLIVWIF